MNVSAGQMTALDGPVGHEQISRDLSVEAGQPDQLERMTQALQTYKVTLVAAGLPVSELSFDDSTNSSNGAAGQRPGSYREALISSGLAHAGSEAE